MITLNPIIHVLSGSSCLKKVPTDNSIIRIKSGEPIFDVSTANKKELYPNRKYIKGFKIDIRFVMDVDGKEIDLAAARVAKDVSKNKTMLDEGKLTREGKDIVDNLVDILSNIDLKSRQAYLTLDLARVAGCMWQTHKHTLFYQASQMTSMT